MFQTFIKKLEFQIAPYLNETPPNIDGVSKVFKDLIKYKLVKTEGDVFIYRSSERKQQIKWRLCASLCTAVVFTTLTYSPLIDVLEKTNRMHETSKVEMLLWNIAIGLFMGVICFFMTYVSRGVGNGPSYIFFLNTKTKKLSYKRKFFG